MSIEPTDEILALIEAHTELKVWWEDQKTKFAANIEAARNAQDQTFFVDQANGNDAADGTRAAPLRSLDEAASRAVSAGLTTIELLGDYEQSVETAFPNGKIVIRGDGAQRTLSFAAEIDGVSEDAPHLRVPFHGGELSFVNLDIVSRVLSTHVTRKYMVRTTGLTRVILNSCDLTAASGDDLAFLSGTHMFGLISIDTTIAADFAGLIVRDVASGTDPNSLANCAFSNLATV